MSGAVPTTTSEITVDWLTEALRSSGTIGETASVSSVRVDPQTGGVGFMGEVGKLVLDYDGAPDAPTSMVAKFPTQSPEVMAMMHPTRVFEREHRFYEVLAHETQVRTPDVYHVTCDTSDDPAAERYLLLMEDLGGLTLGDQVAGVSPEQAESALVGLARHHAHFWNGAGLEQATFAPIINGPLNKAGQGIYSASLPGFREVFGSALQPEMVPVADAYTAAHPKLLDALAAMPHTLVHFDYRSDNLFFEDTGDGTGDVCVIDWQSISIGGGAADVGYFLGQNLSPAERRAHEDDLLHRYHDTLVAGGVTDYGYDRFFQDYRLGVVYGWVIPVFAVGSLDVSSERAMTLWTNVLERVQDAIFHHGAQEFVV
ncbi:MAG: oxidoreductase family protein [Actinomycetota bacterium]